MRRLRDIGGLSLALVLIAAHAMADDKSDAAQDFSGGLSAMSRGDLDEASRRFEAVIKLDPQSFEAHNNLAVIYTEQKNYQAALAELNTVLQLKPDYYRGRKNLAELYARLAHEAFLGAADVAPPDDKDRLKARARLIGAPSNSPDTSSLASGAGEPAAPPLPAAAEAPKAAPAATPKVETAAAPAPMPALVPPASDGSPVELVALADGVPGLTLSDTGLRLHRQVGSTVQPAERIPVKQPAANLPSSASFYVAVPGEGQVQLVPLERGGRTLTIRDAAGKADVVVDPAAFTVLQQALRPYLSPALVGATLPAGDARAAQTRHLTVLSAFSSWSKGWQAKNLQGYLDSYIPDYNPRGGPGAQKWREQRAKVFERSGDITIELSDPIILDAGKDVITLTRQEYRSKLQSSVGVKKVTWTSTPEGWRITSEEMLSEKIQKTPRA